MNYEKIRQPYQAQGFPSIQLGEIVVGDRLLSEAPVNLVLKSFNRHGLIAGATGSGKTKTIQALCEQLSKNGVPAMVMDIKGDISGLAAHGENNEKLTARNQSMQLPFKPRAFSCELLTLDDKDIGIPLRARLDEMGPLLFSRMLELNDTQAGVITVLFEYAKNEKMSLIDLADIKALLKFVQTDKGKSEIQKQFGAVSGSSVGAVLRKIIELESQNANSFFGEPAFAVNDLLRQDANGEGMISILRLIDMQDKPKLFSTFMLKLLSDIYRAMPEAGDLDKPKLIVYIDDAHLMFKQATRQLLSLVDTMVKLIRSKGVGLIFCTQTPNDIPDAVLSQLGLKIQHALRAFTAKDRKAMRLVAQNFPPSDIYNTEQLLTSLGIGEALVSALDAKGVPTPLIHCRIRAPESRMGVLDAKEASAIVTQSSLSGKYGQRIERESAMEALKKQAEVAVEAKNTENNTSEGKSTGSPSSLETLTKNTLFRQLVRQIARQITSAFLALFKTSGRKRK